MLDLLTEKAASGSPLEFEEALSLFDEPLDALAAAAEAVRRRRCDSAAELCAIVNGKNGRCSEDCAFCVQSVHHATNPEVFPLRSPEAMLRRALHDEARGARQFSIVTAGRALAGDDLDQVVEAVRLIRGRTALKLCASLGLLDEEAYRRLKRAGLSRVHCNIETSREFFPSVCTTHSFDDKIASIEAAHGASLEVCSGVLVGIGESPRDIVSMGLTLRELGVVSVPVNMLNPIPGTPLGNREPLAPERLQRIMAVFRFLVPDAFIRLAAGRAYLPDTGRRCLESGANAIISGDFMTTSGYSVESDRTMLADLGFTLS